MSNIEDNEDRMMEIMAIDDEINNISKIKKLKVNIDLLSNNTIETTNSLKSSVEWNEYMNSNTVYTDLYSICDLEQMNEFIIIGNDLVSHDMYEMRISDEEYKTNLIELISLPYVDVLNLEDSSLLNMFRKYLEDSDYNKPYYIKSIIDEKYIYNFMIHQSGFVVVYIKNIDENTTKEYVSMIRIDYNEFSIFLSKDSLNKYNNANDNKTKNVLFTQDYLNNNEAIHMTIIENACASFVGNLTDKEKIDVFMSILNLEDKLFYKEIKYRSELEFFSISIGLTFESNDGNTDYWTCYISEEGIIRIKNHNDSYVYYTDKNAVNYDQLFQELRNLMPKG